jgi:hypothetical protein
LADDIPEPSVFGLFIVIVDKLAKLLKSFDEHFQELAGSQELTVYHEEYLSSGDLLY